VPLTSFTKQPSETVKRPLPVDGAGAIASIVQVAAMSRGLVAGSAPLSAAGSIEAGALFVELAGGTDGERYLVTAQVEDSAGELREAELEIAVLDYTWAMPDGGDGYVSIKYFVDLFGLEETVRMTDVAGSGRIDRAFLVSKLVAAQAVADAHLSARYAVPLAEAPELVKAAIADMARGRLYPNGVPDDVAKAAAAALRTLERISEGKLPLPSATPLEKVASSAPILVSAPPRTYPNRLADY
jgi:phage gp36-like protein